LNCVSISSYIESAKTLSRETNLDMNKFEVCDNVSLETVLMEYEAYYHVKFQRYPKITKKLTQSKTFSPALLLLTLQCCKLLGIDASYTFLIQESR
jgi:hypothetical protein